MSTAMLAKQITVDIECFGSDALLKASMYGFVGRISLRQILPWRTGAGNPENTIEEIAFCHGRLPRLYGEVDHEYVW